MHFSKMATTIGWTGFLYVNKLYGLFIHLDSGFRQGLPESAERHQDDRRHAHLARLQDREHPRHLEAGSTGW